MIRSASEESLTSRVGFLHLPSHIFCIPPLPTQINQAVHCFGGIMGTVLGLIELGFASNALSVRTSRLGRDVNPSTFKLLQEYSAYPSGTTRCAVGTLFLNLLPANPNADLPSRSRVELDVGFASNENPSSVTTIGPISTDPVPTHICSSLSRGWLPVRHLDFGQRPYETLRSIHTCRLGT